jgi:glucokinase
MCPPHQRDLDPADAALAHVVDIGGSHVTAAAVERGPRPRVVDRSSSAIDTHGDRETLLRVIGDVLRPFAAHANAWTIALPGPFDYETGIGSFEGVEKFSALANLDLRAALSAMLGIAERDVRFINDAIAYGIGEWYVSDTRPERFVCITLGTGIGSVFLDGGRPVEDGPEVPQNGWAHLLRFNGAPLEDAVSTRAIQGRYGQEEGQVVEVRTIAERARAGEIRARKVLETAMFELGEVLAPWTRSFRATEVVVGGSMARSWDILGPAFVLGVTGQGMTPPVIWPSRLLDDAPLIGAAVHAWQSGRPHLP